MRKLLLSLFGAKFITNRSIISIILLLLFYSNSIATTVTHTFTGTSGTIDSNISFTTEKNDAGSNPYFGSELRLYYASSGNGCSITLTPSNGAIITGFKITAVSDSYTPTMKYNVDGAGDLTNSWVTTTNTVTSISAFSSLKIRNANTTNTQMRLQSIEVTYTVPASCSGEPTAQATNISISGETATTLDVSWAAGTGGDEYILVCREGSSVSWTPTDGTDYSAQTGSGDFSTATDQSSGNKVVYSGSGTSTTVTGLSASTTYYFQVFHLCSNDSNNYLTSSGTNNDGTQTGSTTSVSYCTPAPSSGDGSGITNITMGTIDNDSGQEAGYYGDYSAQSTDVEQGATVNCDITYETGYTYNTIIWVDWNNDGDFNDTGEEVYTGESASSNPTTLNASFSVPGGASLGAHRLRIGGADTSTPTPCYTGTYAIFEDYTINVIASSPTITLSTTTLTGFNYIEGAGPSANQTFTISGANLVGSGNITVTGTTNYEVSTDGSSYSGSVTYPYASGEITGQPQTVYVRLKSGLSAGDYNSENIQVSGGSATTENLTCSGSVYNNADWCNLQSPGIATIASGQSLTVYARIYEAGLTTNSGEQGTISCDIGYSTSNTNPNTWTNWESATFNIEDGNNDEYMSTFADDFTSGTYYYASRFSINGGSSYAYGGYNVGGGNFWDGTSNVSGVLTVNDNYADFCNVNDPASGTITEGDSFTVESKIWEDGVTNMGSPGAGITAWIGYSTTNTNPAGWTNWVVANFSGDALNDDLFEAEIGSSLPAGTYYYASRFRVDPNNEVYSYGGYNGGAWDGASNVSGVLTVNPGASCATDLIISEYYEGGGNDKYIEIYNGTGSSVDLSNYKLSYYSNGSTTANDLALSGTLADGATHIYANSTATATILGFSQQDGSLFINGDDAIALRTTGGSIVDVIGQIGTDPGSEWGSGLTSTADNTLVRKSSITDGDTNGSDAFDPSTEWDGYANITTYAGAHTMTCVTGPEINIQVSATNYLTGSTYDFGAIEDGSSSSVITFTIQNTGTSALAISGTPKVAISGTNASEFTIDETSTNATVSASGTTTFTITFSPTSVAAGKTATISIANDDTDENPYTIILTGEGTAPDLTDPTVTTLSPIDNATDVDIATNLVITFDENIDAGTGNIEIRRTSDDGLVESFDVTTDISISGAVVTINPSSDLSYSTEYYVLIDATAIVDLATTPNNYAGISSTTAWSFTTMDVPAVPENIIPCREDYEGYPDWTDTDAFGSGVVVLNDPTSSIISPAMNFDQYTGETLYFDLGTYGGTNATKNTVTVSISVNNGSTWTILGTRTATNNVPIPTTPFDLSSYNGTQVKIKIETLAADGSIGCDLDDICIEGSIICTTPTVQASNILFSNISAYSMQIDWTIGDGINRAVFVKDGSGAITNPTDGVTYIASSDWSSKGTQLGTSGYYCVYNGSGTSVTLTNLDENTEYYVQIFEYGCSTGAQQYYTTTATDNPNNETTTVANPTIIVSPASLDNLDYNLGSGPSVAQSFNISGTDLTAGPITITAPTNFLVCSTEGGTYVSSYTIPYTSPTLASTTVYVKLAGGLSVNTYLGNVTCAGGNATTQNVSVRGDVLPIPLITITGSDITLNDICDAEGTYSTIQSFDLEGSNLSADLTVGFGFTSSKIELSSDNTNWYSATTTTLSFTPVANSVSETIYVRSVGGEGTTAGSTATVQCKSTSATTQTLDIDYVINGLPFIGSPSDITVAEGNPASFSIFDPTGLTFQWQQSEPFPSTTWIDLIGETSNSLTLSTVSAEMDQYKYRIYATNANGCTDTSSFSSVLTVTSTGLINSCGTQNFTTGTAPPSGWTFTNINTTNGSALEMDATNDRIVTGVVTAPTLMSFWLQGLGTMTGSSLLVEGFNGFSWNTIENITSIPTSSTTKTYTVGANSIDNYSKFRFTFTKGASSANLAFDDVDITCGVESDDAWILDESFDNITSIADINNNLTDVPGFTAADAGGATLTSGTIVCKYNRNSGSLKLDGTDGGTITITTPTLTAQPDLLTFYTAGPGNGDIEIQTSTTAKASFTTIETLTSIPAPGTIHFIPLNTDVVKVRFIFTQGSTGYAYFDDIRIRDASAGGNSGNDIKILQTLIETCNLGSEGEDEFVVFKTGARDIAVSDLSVSFPGGGIGGNEHSMDATNQLVSVPSWISDVNDIVELTNPGCRPVKEPIAGVIPANSYAIFFTGNSPEKYDFKELCPSTTYYAIFSNNTNGTGKYTNTPDPGTNYYTTIIDKSTGSYDTQYYNSLKTCGSGCTAYYDESTRALSYDANGCVMTLLPIELLSFTADCDYGDINLKWVTSSETNNDFFTIEKSYDMENWAIVSNITGAGNSSSQKTYTYTDNSESAKNVYYRLKQTDFDGAFTYFDAIAINCFTMDNRFLLYPNPTNSQLKCEFYSPYKDYYIVEIINALGQNVFKVSYELDEGLNNLNFDLSNLSKGVYYFKLYSLNGEINKIHKITKQ